MGSTAGKPDVQPTEAKDKHAAKLSSQAAKAGTSGQGASSPGGKAASPSTSSRSRKEPITTTPRTVLGKYHMRGCREDIMGKGTSSICHKGIEVETGRPVAIKIYKDQQNSGGKIKDTTMQKFTRQIDVLTELLMPFKEPEDKSLWSDVLSSTIGPKQVFMQLIDYSKGPDGRPGPDPEDGMLYVVTELAGYSLKDFLADRREKQKMLSREGVRDLTKRVLLAMTGLHAKGLVHIDMKPENLMVFDGRLKVIDVDGCVRLGSRVSINDGSISFSPCYCSPEWARFMIKEAEQTITATPSLDVWSVGMILCELIALDAIWKPQYANFMRNASSHREAGFLFLEWLGDMNAGKIPLPRAIERFDPNFLDLLLQWLLVVDVKERKTSAQTLSNEWLAQGGWAKYGEKQAQTEVPQHVVRVREKDDSIVRLHSGVLFKLNTNGNPQDLAHWIKRDMWVAHNRSICYYSVKENKKLVLMDGTALSAATIRPVKGTVKEFAFEILSKGTADEPIKIVLAADSQEELDVWSDKFSLADSHVGTTFQLGEKMAAEIKAFKIAVQNRRMKVSGDRESFEPNFKAKLWKLKAGGDRAKEDDWFLRDMWIARNGSLVYFSPKEDRDLVYYTAKDVATAQVDLIPEDAQGCKAYGFTVQLQAGEVEFAPGVFAAETQEMREQWVAELSKCMGPGSNPGSPGGKPEAGAVEGEQPS